MIVTAFVWVVEMPDSLTNRLGMFVPTVTMRVTVLVMSASTLPWYGAFVVQLAPSNEVSNRNTTAPVLRSTPAPMIDAWMANMVLGGTSIGVAAAELVSPDAGAVTLKSVARWMGGIVASCASERAATNATARKVRSLAVDLMSRTVRLPRQGRNSNSVYEPATFAHVVDRPERIQVVPVEAFELLCRVRQVERRARLHVINPKVPSSP